MFCDEIIISIFLFLFYVVGVRSAIIRYAIPFPVAAFMWNPDLMCVLIAYPNYAAVMSRKIAKLYSIYSSARVLRADSNERAEKKKCNGAVRSRRNSYPINVYVIYCKSVPSGSILFCDDHHEDDENRAPNSNTRWLIIFDDPGKG